MNRATLGALAALLVVLMPATALAQTASHGGPCPTDVDCTGGTRPAAEGNATCMDGQQGNETCDGNVRYVGAPSSAGPCPQDVNCTGGVRNDTQQAQASAAADAKHVPAASLLVVVGVLATSAILLLALRKR